MPLDLEPQPRILFRHYVNHRILKLKMGITRSARKAQLFLDVRQFLEDAMVSTARRVYNDEEFATKAAAKAINDIRSCSMYLTSRRQESNLLTAIYRQFKRAKPEVEQRRKSPDVEDAWPTWMRLLLTILVQSHRSWTYIWLYRLRDREWGWKGRLTELYLGDQRRQAALVRDLGTLESVTEELADAYESIMHVQDPPMDDIERPLNDLNELQASVADPEVRPLCDLIWKRVVDWNGGSACCPNLAKALSEATAEDRLGGVAPDPILYAVDELINEVERPGSRLPPASCILAVLDRLPPDHQNERKPGDVLRDIGALSAQGGAGAFERRLDQDESPDEQKRTINDRRKCVLDQLDASGLGRSAFYRLMLCQSFDEIRNRLLPQLEEQGTRHGPRALAAILVEEVPKVLAWWQKNIAIWQTPTRNAPAAIWVWQEMPTFVWEHPAILEDALALLKRWGDDRNGVPAAWPAVGEGARKVLVAALLDLILDDLVTKMVHCYRG